MNRSLLGVSFFWLVMTHCLADISVKVGPGEPVKVSVEAFELLPHQTVKARDHGGVDAEWTGVPLYQVLQHAGFHFGDELRGSYLAQYVLVTASDGYRVVLALPELDPRSTDDPVILADSMNGQSLVASQGPLRLVLPRERRHFPSLRKKIRGTRNMYPQTFPIWNGSRGA